MAEKFIRIYKKLDVNDIKPHLLIYGDLSGSCGACNNLDIKLDETKCPKCSAEFNYISFRYIKSHIPKMYKLLETRPDIIFVDHDDYTKTLGASKAEDLFK